VLIAAILHDTIEDTETTAEELTAIFGVDVHPKLTHFMQ
jgi:(p)ppGpp synthase/HD superfamily hydrolase